MQLRPVVLSALLVAAPSLAAAQQDVAPSAAPVPPSLVVRFDGRLAEESLTPEPASYLSAPAAESLSPKRSTSRIPWIGAGLGAAAGAGYVAYACMTDGCGGYIPIHIIVPTAGAVAGGVAGLLVEWTVQGFEEMKRAPSQPGA